MEIKTEYKPIDVTGDDEPLLLQRDNFSVGDFWILTNGFTISIAEQKRGEDTKQHINIPVETFAKLVAWMTEPQKTSQRGVRVLQGEK